MQVTWEEEPALTFNNVNQDSVYTFPRGKPFTEKNVMKYLNAIADGTFSKLKLSDADEKYQKSKKSAKRIRNKDNYENAVTDKTKGILILLYNGTDINFSRYFYDMELVNK
jgi:hypothetical protein